MSLAERFCVLASHFSPLRWQTQKQWLMVRRLCANQKVTSVYKLHIDEYFARSDDQFALYPSDPEGNDQQHCHEFDELVLVERGHGLHVLNGKPCYIQQGDVFYVHAGDRHCYDELGSLKLTNVLINKQKKFHFLSNIDPLLHNLCPATAQQPCWLLPEQREGCLQLAQQLTAISQECDPIAQAQQEALFLQLIVTIMRSAHTLSRGHTHYKLYQLIAWLQENCFDEIDWETAGQAFLLTRRTIHRQMKEMTGMTPESFLRRLRLVAAREKLRTSDASITDIAFLCGFASSNHFATCYKQLFGRSPSQERQRSVA